MKQKKNILFIMGKLDSGGVSKSMLSLLNVIDKEGYNISLLLINTTGVFTNNVPKGVEVLMDTWSGGIDEMGVLGACIGFFIQIVFGFH